MGAAQPRACSGTGGFRLEGESVVHLDFSLSSKLLRSSSLSLHRVLECVLTIPYTPSLSTAPGLPAHLLAEAAEQRAQSPKEYIGWLRQHHSSRPEALWPAPEQQTRAM